MDLVTSDYVKALDNTFSDTIDDGMLGVLITGISAKATNYLRRHIPIAQRTEKFDYTAELSVLKALSAYPISVMTSLIIKDGTDLTPFNVFDYNSSNGELILNKVRDIVIDPILNTKYNIPYGFEMIQVTYTGGMVSSTSEFMTIYPDICYELAMQILFEMRRKKTLGLDNASIDRTGKDTYTKWGLREDLIRVLKPHRKNPSFGF